MTDVTTPEFNGDGTYLRKIRSFVRREGRLTRRQEHALEALWPQYGISDGELLGDLPKLFGRDAPKVLEIGFGMGASLVAMAQAEPDKDFIGIEVHRPGVGACIADAHDAELTNLKVMEFDAVEVLENWLQPACLDRLQLYFPDPWHKKRHHKRRIVQPAFVEKVAAVLKPGGVFHMATDWENYAEHMLMVMQQAEGWQNLSPQGDFCERPAYRPLTKFENRGQRLGHGVWDLLFQRI